MKLPEAKDYNEQLTFSLVPFPPSSTLNHEAWPSIFGEASVSFPRTIRKTHFPSHRE